MALDWIILLLASVNDRSADDNELAARIRNGDHDAFRVFFERHHGAMTAWLLRRSLDRESAQDIIQNAFIHIWERRSEINPGKSLRAYLYKICYSRTLNLFRDDQKFDRFADTDAIASKTIPSDKQAETALIFDLLEKAMEKLPEKRRETFELCFLQGLTYKEAAQVMEISVKTVENQMTAALRHIRQEMKPHLES